MQSLMAIKSLNCFYNPLKRCSILVVLILVFTDQSTGVLKISELLIPKLIENGTQDSVVLDCVYSFDKVRDRNLVVKWFLNDEPEPIYQWIPEYDARLASARVQGRINLDYFVNSTEPLTKYRALNLLRPTIDLSGSYICHVQSLESQDSREETMIIYAKPKDIEFNYKPVTEECRSALSIGFHISEAQNSYLVQQPLHSVSFELFCKVSDVYPLPYITIYRMAEDGSKPRTLDTFDARFKKEEKVLSNFAFNASLSAFISDEALIRYHGDGPSLFGCLVILNEINLEIRKSFKYFPVIQETNASISKTLELFLVLTIIITLITSFKLNMN